MPSFESARRRITSTLGHLSLGRRSEDTPSETPSQTTAARSRTKGALDFFRFRKDPEASTSQEPTAETDAPETSAAPPKKKRWRFRKLSSPRSETQSNAGLTEIVSTDAPPLSTITEDARKKGKKAIRTVNDYERESDSESVKDIKTTKVILDQVRLDTSEDINRWTNRAMAVVEGHQAWLQRHTPVIDIASSPTELPNLRQMQETTLETIGEAHKYMRLHLLNQHRSLIDTNQILADLQGITPDITVDDLVALPNIAHEAKERIERLIDVITLHQTYNQLEKVRISYSKYNPTGTLPIEGIEALHNQAMDLSRNLDKLTSEFGLSETDFQRFSGMTADNIRETVNGELQNRDISHDEKRKIWLSAHVAILRKQSNGALDSIYNKLNKDIIDMRRDFFRWTDRKGSETRAGKSKNTPEYQKLEDAIIKAAGDIEPNINPASNLTNEEKSTCFKDAIERVQYYDQTFDTFRQKRKDEGIEEEWVQEGRNRTDGVNSHFHKRRVTDGMTQDMVERSYNDHYDHIVGSVTPEYWKVKRFEQLAQHGVITGTREECIYVGMQPKIPDGFNPSGVGFRGMLVLKALVSFHRDGDGRLYGSIVNINADLVDDNKWRTENYPQAYLDHLSAQEELPEKYGKALHPSELTRKAYQLAYGQYKDDHPEVNPNTPLPPIREFIGYDIVFPGSREPLHGYGEAGQADTFTRGNQEGDKVVNLARCTHYGPRPEFLKLDDPGLVPGEIGSATIYRELNDKGEEHKMHLKFTMVEA